MSDINEQAEFYKAGAFPEKTSRQYDLLLMRLERWIEELAAQGPSHVTEVYREMEQIFKNENARAKPDYCEPCIDFNHQKGYN